MDMPVTHLDVRAVQLCFPAPNWFLVRATIYCIPTRYPFGCIVRYCVCGRVRVLSIASQPATEHGLLSYCERPWRCGCARTRADGGAGTKKRGKGGEGEEGASKAEGGNIGAMFRKAAASK